MRSELAFELGRINRGKERMVFDWDKAAKRIKEENAVIARAGLEDDWEWTGGTIFRNGSPVKEYTYLASTWAVPELELDGVREPCYVMESQTKWDENTQWPQSALKILGVIKDR